ncbi:MAG: hypothetical protein KIS62_17180 [Ramlibacter sp.]|nr:hypothetical protein [Ramlibacter sp.]
MTSVIEMRFGLAGMNTVRVGLGDRSHYARQLNFQELNPFATATEVVNLVNALAPMGAAGLSAADFRTLVAALAAGGGAMTPAQMLAVVGDLAPLTATQIRTLLMDLVTGVGAIQPGQAATLIAGLCQGGGSINGTQVRTVFTALRAQLSPTDLHDALTELLPSSGALVLRVYSDLCHPGGNGLGGTHFREVIRLFRAAPGHLNAVTPTQLDALTHDLRIDPLTATPALTGTQIRGVARALLHGGGALTPANARTLLMRLRVSLTIARTEDLITATAGNFNNLAIRPTWLLDASAATTAGGQAFADRLHNSIASNTNGWTGMRQLLSRMDQARLPADWAVKLLALFPALTPNRHTRMRDFIADGVIAVAALSNRWVEDVLDRLQGFLDDGRYPHGVNRRHAAAGVGGAIVRARNINDAAVLLKDERLNYFCNSHTYMHCHFSNRLAQGVASIEFWDAGQTRQAIITDFANVPGAWLYNLATAAMNAPGRYASNVYNNTLEVGLYYQGWNNAHDNYAFNVTHFSPAGQNRVPTSALRAISHLFDDTP